MLKSKYDLEKQGIKVKNSLWNLSRELLVEHTIKRGEGKLAKGGALAIDTGKYTGRSPNDKFIVKDSITENTIDWKSKFSHEISPENFNKLEKKVKDYLINKEVYVRDAWAGADKNHRIAVRFINIQPSYNMFVANMFKKATKEELEEFIPEYTVIQCPEVLADATTDGTRSETFIALSLSKKLLLIGGTEYSGEIKKGIFGVLNYLLVEKEVMPMHCSVNVGKEGDVAVFFGLSGTGKTTLSSDPLRKLIGDDEHGWSGESVFNFEGGCYAKVVDLKQESEPEIFKTTHTFGSILENIVMDENTRIPDFTNRSKTENTRVSYPIEQIENADLSGVAGCPKNIIMLTADAFGVLPPVSKLTKEQAIYHFISGYTAKLAGTELGVKEPQATFSACFGAPFMSRRVSEYAELLNKKITTHNVKCWLVNTGWSGGPYGVGSRMKLKYTRSMLHAILDGSFNNVEFIKDDFFGLPVPKSCPDVPSDVLLPINTWANKEAYKESAYKLIEMFRINFQQYKEGLPADIIAAEIGK